MDQSYRVIVSVNIVLTYLDPVGSLSWVLFKTYPTTISGLLLFALLLLFGKRYWLVVSIGSICVDFLRNIGKLRCISENSTMPYHDLSRKLGCNGGSVESTMVNTLCKHSSFANKRDNRQKLNWLIHWHIRFGLSDCQEKPMPVFFFRIKKSVFGLALKTVEIDLLMPLKKKTKKMSRLTLY